MLFYELIKSENEMQRLGKTLSTYLNPPFYMALKGELGSGKTTFVRAILRGLGYSGIVKSPTYTLIESYCLNGLQLFHLDLYRISNPQELDFIGMDEIFQPNALSLIEWPEKGEGFLPKPDLLCEIFIKKEARELKFESLSQKGEVLLKHIRLPST